MAHSLVVLGASGAVGGGVVAAALASPEIARVTTLGRRPTAASGAKLHQQVVDVFTPASFEPLLAGHDAAICTLGVGQPSKVTKDELHRVDVDCAADFAAACRRQGVRHFTLMTAIGANPRSRVDYLRYKGEAEERVRALAFPRTSFFRPSMLLTDTNRYGASQGLMLAVFPKINWLLAGPLRKYRGIHVAELGRAMVANVLREGGGAEVLEWDGASQLLAARA